MVTVKEGFKLVSEEQEPGWGWRQPWSALLQGLGSAGAGAESVLQFHCKSTGSSLVGGTAQGCLPSCFFTDVEMVSPNCLEHQAVR